MIKNLLATLTTSILLQLVTMNAFGQKTFQLKVKLVDKTDSTVIPFSTISLIDQNGKTRLSVRTDIDGNALFILPDSANNKMHLYTKPLGYKQFSSTPLSFDSIPKNYFIRAEKNMIDLHEVSIFEHQVEKDAGKLTYRVKQDQFSANTAIAEIFTKLPGVSVVAGTVKVNDKSGVLILIDGKGELKDQRSQLALLLSLSADQIDKIEINSFPSARYDASVNAVINVITKKDRNISNIRASVAQPLFIDQNSFGSSYIYGGASTNLNFTLNKVKVSLLMGLNTNRHPETLLSQRVIYGVQSYSSQVDANYTSFSLSPNLTLDYDINKRSSVSLNADMTIVPSFKKDQLESYSFYKYNTGTLDSSALVNNNYRNDRKTIQLTTSYKYLLDTKKNSTLFVNAIFSGNPSTVSNQLTKTSAISGNNVIQNTTHSQTNIFNVSAILSDVVKTPFLSTEIGLKSNTLNNNSNQLLNTLTSVFHYHEQLSSLFMSAKWKFGKYTVVSEIRNELLNSTTGFTGNGTTQSADKDYFKVYPHLLIQRTINADVSISVGYIKRIRRPFINFLNPSLIINNYYSGLTGSINNLPAYYNRIEAQVLYKDLGVTAFYEGASNQMFFQPSANPYVYQNTNLGKLNKYGIAAFKGFKIAKWFSSNINADFSYTQKANDGLNYYKNNWITADASISADFTLSKKSRLQADFNYSLKTYMAYNIYGEQVFSTLTLRQLLFKDILSMNIAIADPFGVQKNKTEEYYPELSGITREITNNRIFSIQLIYRFPFGKKFKNQFYKKQNDGEIRN